MGWWAGGLLGLWVGSFVGIWVRGCLYFEIKIFRYVRTLLFFSGQRKRGSNQFLFLMWAPPLYELLCVRDVIGVQSFNSLIYAFLPPPPPLCLSPSPQVTGTLGHRDTGILGHWDPLTLGHCDTVTP